MKRELNWIVFGIDLIQAIQVIVGLAVTYISGKLIQRSLYKLFQKVPFPENVEDAIAKISKYIIYAIAR